MTFIKLLLPYREGIFFVQLTLKVTLYCTFEKEGFVLYLTKYNIYKTCPIFHN